ncbi:MAG: hypothetical protein ABL856_04495, partial [Gallionella sp.]
SLYGPDMLRKWERKYALTTEFGVKAIYGAIIKKLTEMSYEAPLMTTLTVLNHLPPEASARLPELKVLETYKSGAVLVSIPRYDAYKSNALTLAKLGADFIEIAGNRDTILVSVLAPANWQAMAATPVLFTQPILSQPQTKRVVMAVKVAQLRMVLTSYSQAPFELEHVYDY